VEGAAGRAVRVAVIGAGAMANSVHYPSLRSLPGVEIAAICDLDPERLRATGERHGVERRYADYRRMVEETAPDGIYAIGQPHQMYEVWVWCLQRGLPLFIEKPMGLTWHQAQVLAHLAGARAVITQVDHQRRASPLLRRLHAEVTARGPVAHAVCEFYKPGPQPMLGPRDRMMDDCVHVIDTVRWMCGGEVVAVDSRCRRLGTPDINWIGAMLHFDNGSTGFVLTNWCSGRRIFRVEMHAPGICAEADVEGAGRLHADGDTAGRAFDAREVAGSGELYVYGGFREKSREFVESLRTGREQTSSPFRDCLKTMEVAERILARAVLAGE
jgi:virulence factor